jgi:hypothetical protein
MTTTAAPRLAHVHASKNLNADVKVLRQINEMFYEVEVITGAGGWDRPGKVLCVRASIMTPIKDEDEAPAVTDTEEPVSLTAPITGDEYIKVLLARQSAYIARHGGNLTMPPLLEWFIRAEDEPFVILPEHTPAPKREREPRNFTPAAELRKRRDEVQAKLDSFDNDGPADQAITNLSPYSRNKAAARAGRRRFAKMDRDLSKYSELRDRRDVLNHRIALQDAREAKAAARNAGLAATTRLD